MEYRNVNIPKELADRIEGVIKERKLGYTSIAEFVKEAIRERIEFDRQTLAITPERDKEIREYVAKMDEIESGPVKIKSKGGA